PAPAQKKSARRKADAQRTPVRAWRNASTTARSIHVPHRDPSERKDFDDTRDTVAVEVFRGPEYEILGAIEDLEDRELFLAKKKFSRPVMVERLARSEPDFEELERRLIDEASLLARFDHPNVLPLVELAGDESYVYLALEHVEGASLEKIAASLRAK